MLRWVMIVELYIECWPESRLRTKSVWEIWKFSKLECCSELNADCQARHWMFSWMSILQLNIRPNLFDNFGRILNSNAELNVDFWARHWMLSWMLIVELDIECWAECWLSSYTLNADLNLNYLAQHLPTSVWEKFGSFQNSNVEMNIDFELDVDVELNVDCLA